MPNPSELISAALAAWKQSCQQEECPECGHRQHEPGKCEVERGDGYRGAEFKEALGPCTCGMKP